MSETVDTTEPDVNGFDYDRLVDDVAHRMMRHFSRMQRVIETLGQTVDYLMEQDQRKAVAPAPPQVTPQVTKALLTQTHLEVSEALARADVARLDERQARLDERLSYIEAVVGIGKALGRQCWEPPA